MIRKTSIPDVFIQQIIRNGPIDKNIIGLNRLPGLRVYDPLLGQCSIHAGHTVRWISNQSLGGLFSKSVQEIRDK